MPGKEASSTTWLDAPGCGVVTNAFTTRGSRMQLRLTNSLPVEQTVHSLDLFWPVGTNGPLVSARLDGTEAWVGRADRPPLSILAGTPVAGGYQWNYGDLFTGAATTAALYLEVQARCLSAAALEATMRNMPLVPPST